MSKHALSVIIPVYNSEPYLQRLLDSLKVQTWQDFEVIIVNDGSTDNSESLILKYSNVFGDRLKYHLQKNRGVAAARNAGLDAATGEYVSFIDSDDYVYPTFFEKMIDKIHDADIVVCGVTVFVNGDVYEHDKVSRGLTESGFDLVRDSLQRKNAAHVLWNKIFRRELFNDFRFIEGYMFEDMYGCALIPLGAKKVVYISDELYAYCRRDDSLSAAVTDRKMADLVFLSERLIEVYTSNGALYYLNDAVLILLSGIVETICKFYVKDLVSTNSFKEMITNLLALRKRVRKMNPNN